MVDSADVAYQGCRSDSSDVGGRARRMPSSLSRGNWANPAISASLTRRVVTSLDAAQALERPGRSSACAGEWTPPLVIPRRGIRGDNGQPFRRVVQGEADDERRTDSQRAPTA